ncbi:hypothetical protein PENSPDRAFT_672720 [Peniophora sp. CONT]|nr:hypothetical protein PENSPDRAFT_672720 [Peniophora sp. CONT]
MNSIAEDLQDFSIMNGFAEEFADKKYAGTFLTTSDGNVALFHCALDGSILKEPRSAVEGHVVAIKPEADQNIANEKYWFAIIMSYDRGGPIKVRWFASVKYTRRSIAPVFFPKLVENSTHDLSLRRTLKRLAIPDTTQLLTDTYDDVDIASIHCVLSAEEFKSITWDPNHNIKWTGKICRIVS